ncbi:MAG: YggS family pyridoxal phosphate-dependent enzyme [Alphaproteobacteria bacterium]|nr:MAG: YggS family pyridoxal phosphate-dependent enzyme [Alphaproteobacteria bacterium]
MSIADWKKLSEEIKSAAQSCGRDPADVALLLASKTQPQDVLVPYLKAGHRLFGENRVQEAAEKWVALKEGFPKAKLHLIGPLQTNKVKTALEIFDLIETLDREKLAESLAAHGCTLPCYIQVNTGEEPQKSGIAPHDLPAFFDFCTKDCKLEIRGLMCIPPADEAAAPHFALLNKLAAAQGLTELSMGMSGDYDTAITFGATEIRIGTAVFGKRKPDAA